MASSKHPTSPHLQIYRLPLTALLSITHRITGVILSLGCLLLVWILAAAAFDPVYYNAMLPYLDSWVGKIFMLGLIFSLYLHFCNGIRHLFWDAGYGFALDTVDLTAKLAIAVAILLTIATWFAGS